MGGCDNLFSSTQAYGIYFQSEIENCRDNSDAERQEAPRSSLSGLGTWRKQCSQGLWSRITGWKLETVRQEVGPGRD
jgi:hypothetical protein